MKLSDSVFLKLRPKTLHDHEAIPPSSIAYHYQGVELLQGLKNQESEKGVLECVVDQLYKACEESIRGIAQTPT